MALVRRFERKEISRPSLHKEISPAEYSVFERDGRIVLQIDTYGSKDREKPGKQSQTIQLDHEGAAALFDVLKGEFRLS